MIFDLQLREIDDFLEQVAKFLPSEHFLVVQLRRVVQWHGRLRKYIVQLETQMGKTAQVINDLESTIKSQAGVIATLRSQAPDPTEILDAADDASIASAQALLATVGTDGTITPPASTDTTTTTTTPVTSTSTTGTDASTSTTGTDTTSTGTVTPDSGATA